MNADSRLNLLLTHGQPDSGPTADLLEQHPAHRPPWYRSLSALLAPMGVRTFEATSGPEAMDVIAKNPIHLAVVDSRLGSDDLSLPKLIQKIREHTPPPIEPQTSRLRVEVKFTQPGQQPVEFRLETNCDWPTVILLMPRRNDQVLPEALKCNVFSVVNEPVDVNLMLEIMARALKRFHQNQWPRSNSGQ